MKFPNTILTPEMRDAMASQVHELYLATAAAQGWKVRDEVNVPFAALTDEAKALDYAIVDWHQRNVSTLHQSFNAILERTTLAVEARVKEADDRTTAMERTLRDSFAAAALEGMVPRGGFARHADDGLPVAADAERMRELAADAYALADAMLAHRAQEAADKAFDEANNGA